MKRMITMHKLILGDARNMKSISSESVDLVVTSPPYPMIQMWDEMFSSQNPEIKKAINSGNGELAFELIHTELDKTWNECYRVLKKGGIACINIGDATRTVGEKFQIYPNHSRILNHFLKSGFHALPSILWIKETNKPDKFMGSGMLPVGAYVTLEHEHVLVLRKGGKREFKRDDELLNRRKSAFFWEERNIWFSDKWQNINGALQKLNNDTIRKRSAAYPFELAYRLINMFSVQDDTVLDPFIGTGTTTIAAIASARNSIGIEIDADLSGIIKERISASLTPCNDYNKHRIKKHLGFVEKRNSEGGKLDYINAYYNFPVMTRQETEIKIPLLKSVAETEDNLFKAEYI